MPPICPMQEAAAISKKNGFTNDCADIGLAPSHVWVTMCDGTTARKLINYEVDSARVETNRYLNIDEETGEYVSGEDLDVLQIPYTVEGARSNMLEVVDYDKSTIEQDMKTLRERQESLRQRSGSTEVTGEAGDLEGAAEQVREFSGETVTANSTLSEYLARCMLGQTGLIDLTGVPGSGDADLVADALLEAYYQNPLILGLQGYRINKDATKLKITYEEDAAEAAKKQQEIKAKVSEVTAEIITPGMTDLKGNWQSTAIYAIPLNTIWLHWRMRSSTIMRRLTRSSTIPLPPMEPCSKGMRLCRLCSGLCCWLILPGWRALWLPACWKAPCLMPGIR